MRPRRRRITRARIAHVRAYNRRALKHNKRLRARGKFGFSYLRLKDI